MFLLEPFFPPFLVFVGNSYLRHFGAKYLDHPYQYYHVYFVLGNINLPDTIKVCYRDYLPIIS